MKISIIIPTLNEEENIFRLITSLRSESYGDKTEIVVADGGSQDRTVSIARNSADVVVECPEPGRAAQMHQGALAASGDLLLFLHADTRLPEHWTDTLRKAWEQHPRPAATAFSLRFEDKGLFYRFLAAAANWRTRRTSVPHGDQAIAVARESYFKAGGFPPVPIMEEYSLLGKLRGLGSVRILPESVVTSTRRYQRNGRIFNVARNTFIIVLFYLGIHPRVLARFYQ